MQATDVTASPRRRRSTRDLSISELCDRINRLERKYIRIGKKCHSIAKEDATRPEREKVQAAQNRLIDILIERPIATIDEAAAIADIVILLCGVPPDNLSNEALDTLYHKLCEFIIALRKDAA